MIYLLSLILTIPCFLCSVEYKYDSQVGQDKYLNEEIFKNKRNGVYVDIGAYDGITGNNTSFFEKNLGWTGICVEPIPDRFADLQKNRPNSININCAIGDKGKREFLRINGENEMLSGLLSKYDPRHRELIDNVKPISKDKHEILMIDCIPIMEILEKNNIKHIDYLSIDTEGGELDILKSIDFDKVDIEIIDVENNYYDPNFHYFLASKGYKHITRIVIDDIYQKIRN